MQAVGLCTTEVWNAGYYYCPSGGTLTGTTCTTRTFLPLRCPDGYVDSGGECRMLKTTYSSGSVGGQCSAIVPKPASWVSWGYNSTTRSCDFTTVTYTVIVASYVGGGYYFYDTYTASYQPGSYSYPTYSATYNAAYYACPSAGTLNGTTCRYS